MKKTYTFGNPNHEIVPLSKTPGEVSGVESFAWKNFVSPGEMEDFDFLESGAKRDFPEGGCVEVITFDGWRDWRSALFHSTLQVIGVRLKPGATLKGPVCFREIKSDTDAIPEAGKVSVGDRYVLPLLGIIATIAMFVFADNVFYSLIVGGFAALFIGFSLSDRKNEKIPGEVAKNGGFRVFGPTRKTWN